MARPRKYIQVDGKTVDGVSFHEATGRYYIYDQRGKQVYFRRWQEARDAYQRRQGDPVAIAKENAAYAVRHAAMQGPEAFAKLVALFAGDQDSPRFNSKSATRTSVSMERPGRLNATA